MPVVRPTGTAARAGFGTIRRHDQRPVTMLTPGRTLAAAPAAPAASEPQLPAGRAVAIARCAGSWRPRRDGGEGRGRTSPFAGRRYPARRNGNVPSPHQRRAPLQVITAPLV